MSSLASAGRLIGWYNPDNLAAAPQDPFAWPNAVAATTAVPSVLPAASRASGVQALGTDGAWQHVRFTGAAADVVTIPINLATARAANGGSSYTIIVVARMAANGGGGRLIAGANNGWALGFVDGAEDVAVGCGATLGNLTGPSAAGVVGGVWRMYAEVYDAALNTLSLHRDGVPIAVGVSGVGCGPGGIALGGTLGAYAAGDVREVAVYAEALGLAARQAAEGWFAHKFGLVSVLPAGHAYRYATLVVPSPSAPPPTATSTPCPNLLSVCAPWAQALLAIAGVLGLGSSAVYGYITKCSRHCFTCFAHKRWREVMESRARHPLASALHAALLLDQPGFRDTTEGGQRLLAVEAAILRQLAIPTKSLTWAEVTEAARAVVVQYHALDGFPQPVCCGLVAPAGATYIFLQTHVDAVVAALQAETLFMARYVHIANPMAGSPTAAKPPARPTVAPARGTSSWFGRASARSVHATGPEPAAGHATAI